MKTYLCTHPGFDGYTVKASRAKLARIHYHRLIREVEGVDPKAITVRQIRFHLIQVKGGQHHPVSHHTTAAESLKAVARMREKFPDRVFILKQEVSK